MSRAAWCERATRETPCGRTACARPWPYTPARKLLNLEKRTVMCEQASNKVPGKNYGLKVPAERRRIKEKRGEKRRGQKRMSVADSPQTQSGLKGKDNRRCAGKKTISTCMKRVP